MTTVSTGTATEARSENAAPATGRIAGVNHLVLGCSDMDATRHFYCDILGLRLRLNRRAEDTPNPAWVPGRFEWYELGNGDVVALREVPGADLNPDASFSSELWPEPRPAPKVARKLDHLAFNVESLDDLKALRARLVEHAWPVSEVLCRRDLVHSIYFYDPDKNPLEAATWASPGDGAPAPDPNAPRTMT